MGESQMQEVIVDAAFSDAYDGLMRLLGDAQRFGLELKALKLSAITEKLASAKITLKIPPSLDAQLLRHRLARHPAVLSVQVESHDADAETAVKSRENTNLWVEHLERYRL
jgi:hypothetical protein